MMVAAGNIFYSDGANIRNLSMAAAPAQSFFRTLLSMQRALPQSISVASTGNMPLTFTSITYDPLFPNQSSTCATTLASGATCLLTTAFAPTTAGGPFTGTLTVSDNALNESAAQTSTETGTGLQITQTITFTTSAPVSVRLRTFTVAG